MIDESGIGGSIGRAAAEAHMSRRLSGSAKTVGGLRVCEGEVEGLGQKWLLGTIRVSPGLVEVRSRLRRTGWIPLPVTDFHPSVRAKSIGESFRLGMGTSIITLHSGSTRVEMVVKDVVAKDVLAELFGSDHVKASGFRAG